MIRTLLACLIFVILGGIAGAQKNQEDICLSKDEKELYNLIMTYRKQKNLYKIPLSSSLTKVAKTHAKDLHERYTLNDKCNLHSWSDKGEWSKCCYTNDHKEAECMWNKPKEITSYTSPGYEIAHYHSIQASPESAINGWKNSNGHNQVMINLGQWSRIKWQSMGVAIYHNYAIVWFGEAVDSEGKPKPCP